MIPIIIIKRLCLETWVIFILKCILKTKIATSLWIQFTGEFIYSVIFFKFLLMILELFFKSWVFMAFLLIIGLGLWVNLGQIFTVWIYFLADFKIWRVHIQELFWLRSSLLLLKIINIIINNRIILKLLNLNHSIICTLLLKCFLFLFW